MPRLSRSTSRDPVVLGERVRLAPGPVQRQHELAAQPLAQRMAGHERVQLGDQRAVAAELKLGVDAVLDRGEMDLLEPVRLDRRERLLELGERHAVPQRQRLSELLEGVRRRAGRERGVARLAQVLEAGQVDRLAGQLRRVAGRAGHEHALREHLAEHRDVDLDHLRRTRGGVLAPEVLHEPAHRHRATRLEQQPRQERPLGPAAEGDRLPVSLDAQRTEQPYAQGGAHYAFLPIAIMYSACIRSPPSVASL